MPTSSRVPVALPLDFDALHLDPYPTYELLRENAPVSWSPEWGAVLVTGFDACVEVLSDPSVYSSVLAHDLLTEVLGGRSMLGSDDPEHDVERSVINPTLRPKRMREVWADKFRRNTAIQLDQLEAHGPDDAELNEHFAAPLAARNLADVIGFRDVGPEALARWSRELIQAASANELDAAAAEASEAVRAEIGDALADVTSYLVEHPDDSMVSLMLQSGMPPHKLTTNISLAISGGINEPQHMITNLVDALTDRPDLRPAAGSGPEEWSSLFEEGVRHRSPIGVITRRATVDTTLGGVPIEADTEVNLLLAAANRDPSVFDEPATFRPGRPGLRHVGFSGGPHLCAGKWVAQSSVAHVALPSLYSRFPTLTVDERRESTCEGWFFRGFSALPVTW